MSKQTESLQIRASAGQYVCTINCATGHMSSGQEPVFGPLCLGTEYRSCHSAGGSLRGQSSQLGPSFLSFQLLPMADGPKAEKKLKTCAQSEKSFDITPVCAGGARSAKPCILHVLDLSASCLLLRHFFSTPSSSSKVILNWWEATVYDCLLKVLQCARRNRPSMHRVHKEKNMHTHLETVGKDLCARS